MQAFYKVWKADTMERRSLLSVVSLAFITITGGMSTVYSPKIAKQQSNCGNWVPYTDEKCLRVADISTFQTKQEAEAVCAMLAETEALDDVPRLVTVKSEIEHKTLKQLLFENMDIFDHVWLGVDRGEDDVLRWNNGSELYFNNLAEQNITGTDRQCVQMESGQGIYPMGKWVRVNCRKRNIAVCEMIQVWSKAKLQRSFLNFKSKVERQIEKLGITQSNDVENQAKTKILQKIQGPAISRTKEPSRCGDWTRYKDEKCLKIVTHSGHKTKEEAEIVCQALSEDLNQESYPRLMIVKTQEEQAFLQHFLFTESKVVDKVWLGLQKQGNSSEFQWSDGTSVVYNNWANQSYTDDRHQCVQIASGEEFYAAGLWVKVNCKKVGVVVCERSQTWSVECLKNMFLNYKLEQEKKFIEEISSLKQRNEVSEREFTSLMQKNEASEKEINSLKQKNEASEKILATVNQRIAATEKEIVALKLRNEESEKVITSLTQSNQAVENDMNNVVQNPVPIGIIYTQLPYQEPPSALWPQTKWKEVSYLYAGLFFRVVGGRAGTFGQTQEASNSQLREVRVIRGSLPDSKDVTVPSDGSFSKYLYHGGDWGTAHWVQFRLSGEEPRPRNQAVKVWQRIQ